MTLRKITHAQAANTPRGKILRTQTLYVRISHWLTVPILTGVIITGLYLTYPFLAEISMRQARFYHLALNAILTALVLVRVYYAIITGDARNFTLHRGDGKALIHLMAYYLFIRQQKPYEAMKYNVGQRLIYSSWLVNFILQVITGLVLLVPERTLAFYFQRVTDGLQMIRFIKYIFTIYFIVTIFVHIYLALTSDPAKFQAIFTGYVRVKDGKTEQ